MIEVLIESVDEESQRLSFNQESVTIGRGLGNDIMLEDPQVSRYHARLVVQQDALMLYDLRSRNGTRVNAERISSCAISKTDAIHIGQAVLRVNINGDVFVDESAAEKTNLSGNDHIVHGIEVARENGFSETKVYDSGQLDIELEPVGSAAHRSPSASVEDEDVQSTYLGDAEDPWRIFENCLAPIIQLVRQDDVRSITIPGPNRALVQRDNIVEALDIPLSVGKLEEAFRIISTACTTKGTRFTSTQLFSLRLFDDSCISGCGPDLHPEHGLLVITPARNSGAGAEDLLQQGVLNVQMLLFLHGCVALQKTVLIAGSQAGPLRRFLSALAELIPNDQKICIYGDSKSFTLPHTHLTHLSPLDTARAANFAQLVTLSRPHRVVLTEPLRGALCAEFSEIASGCCPGSIATIQSTSASAALTKLELDSCRTEPRLPGEALRQQIYQAIDVIVELETVTNREPRVTRIAEVLAAASEQSLRIIFERQHDGASKEEITIRQVPSFLSDLESAGFEEASQIFSKTQQ